MTTILDIIRSAVGRRSRITRAEMCDILAAFAGQGVSLANDSLRDSDSEYAPMLWANACTDIITVSVMPEHGGAPTYHGRIRYDEPGRMHPMHMADVLFAPATLAGYDYDQIGQLRRHARRVLVVSGDPLPDPREAAAQQARAAAEGDRVARIVRMLRAELGDSLNPPWVTVLDDGTLEMRNPNHGLGFDAATKPRFQWHLNRNRNRIERRHLPPESVGERWIDSDDAHEWSEYHDCPDNVIGDYIRAVCS
jgi:hypothetical protein